MPIEIRELVIRAVAEAEETRRGASAGAARDDDQDGLVRECVRQVLRILEKERER